MSSTTRTRASEPEVALFGSLGQWVSLAVCIALGVALFTLVDLTPQIEGDFFFANNDPQFQETKEITDEFGDSQQVLIAASSDQLVGGQYLSRIESLSGDLSQIGAVSVRSATRSFKDPGEVFDQDPSDYYEELRDHPFWNRLLIAPDDSATFLVVELENEDNREIIERIDSIQAAHQEEDFRLAISGVPYVAEHIRRRLGEDLIRFSVVAFGAFAILIALLFRSLAVLIGTMLASLSASFTTFLVRPMLGMSTDILAPNLWTIAFVLTLSHVVYLTAQWRSRVHEVGSSDAVHEAVSLTGPASAWSLVANLLGFATLIFVSAQPLRHFGISGGIAAIAAMVCAYTMFPAFLRAAKAGEPAGNHEKWTRYFTSRHSGIAAAAITATVILAFFVPRVNTDPSLVTYFGEGQPIRTGLESIDRSAGSSTLDLVVADTSGGELSDDDVKDRLVVLQNELEQHQQVGTVLSASLLMQEADKPFFSFLVSWDSKFERLDSPENGRVGETFISGDRRRGRFLLQMHEQKRERPREEVIAEIHAIVGRHGFEPTLTGGLYRLQGSMSQLVESSVVRGLGGLLGLFFVIGLIVTRSVRIAGAMVLCLAMAPLMLFGGVGLAGMPLDIISAPAANVALPMGVDEMIHLGYAVRRKRQKGTSEALAWKEALSRLWKPILFAMLIVVAGFALFTLSAFPPTQRLGILVCLGGGITDIVVLLVFPTVAAWGVQGPGRDTRGDALPASHAID